MAGEGTKATILDAAEDLFAEQGYAATSLRQLTTRAGVNLAAVNYHFGGKEALAKAVLARRIAPINRERLRRLAALTAHRRTVEAIVRAFVEPPLRSRTTGDDGAPATRLCRVFGRVSLDQPPFLRAFVAQQFRAVGRRFEAALAVALPGQRGATLWWRLHFLIGAMAHTMQNSAALAHVTQGRCDAKDVDGLIEQLVAFAVGGLRAAPVRTTGRKPA